MRLSLIDVDVSRYQLRDTAYSEQTVDGIVSGFDSVRFGTLPLVASNVAGRFIVAGDGHSRLEACKRLAVSGLLPSDWSIGGDWDIPSDVVDGDAAGRLRFANLSRSNLSACEEAKAFALLRAEGHSIAEIAKLTHRKEGYIASAMPLNGLCKAIRAMVGHPVGISVEAAKALAERFQKYGIGTMRQQELWNKVFAHVDATPSLVRAVMDKIGRAGEGVEEQGMMFAMPESTTSILKRVKDDMERLRRCRRNLAALVNDKDALVAFPELHHALVVHGDDALKAIDAVVDGEGSALVLQVIRGAL